MPKYDDRKPLPVQLLYFSFQELLLNEGCQQSDTCVDNAKCDIDGSQKCSKLNQTYPKRKTKTDNIKKRTNSNWRVQNISTNCLGCVKKHQWIKHQTVLKKKNVVTLTAKSVFGKKDHKSISQAKVKVLLQGHDLVQDLVKQFYRRCLLYFIHWYCSFPTATPFKISP